MKKKFMLNLCYLVIILIFLYLFFTVKNNSYLGTANLLIKYSKRLSIALFINLLAIFGVEYLTLDEYKKRD